MDQEIEETKVYNWQINERIDKLVKKLRVNKLCIEEKEVLYNLLNKVLLNETTKENKNKLLDVIEEVNCYKDLEIDEYINSTITHIISTEIREKYMILKDKISSSNHTIISKVLKDGLLEEDNIIKYSKDDGIELKDIKENSVILIVDDYVGSGKAIIDILKSIENNYNNQSVIVIAYIWQEKAIKKINEYLKETEKNNNYEIHIDENIIIEKSYKERYAEDSSIFKYIRDTCNTCKNKKCKFGYNKTGAMITINGLSPNNNISMLWRDDLGDEETWIPPFSRDISAITMQIKKEKIIKESYSNMRKFYESFYYKDVFDFDEFKMLLLLFNSYYIKIEQIKKLLGLDTNNDVEDIIEKFKEYGIIKYEVDNIIEFVDKKVIEQFKKINQLLNADALENYRKECTNKISL
mgnify:CR=1 FL=1